MNQKNENNYNWKGDDAGYSAIHQWVRANKPQPEHCESCNNQSPIDLANISGEYKRDINDFEYLCRKCHMTKDGRLRELDKYRRLKGEKNPRWKGGNHRNTCINCGKKVYRTSKRCKSCSRRGDLNPNWNKKS